MLSVSGLNHYYAKAHILRDLSLSIGAESVGLFGPNGAGKTTLVNAITGFVRPRSGEITFEETPLLRLQPHQITRMGIATVPQGRELFPLLSVHANLETGAAYIPGARGRMAESLESVFRMFPILKARARQPAGTLSGGEQRMLVIGRALMSKPKLMILDEPTLGLQPSLVTELFRTIREISQQTAVFLAEQNVRQSLKSIDRGYVIENGAIVLEGTSEDLLDNEHVRRAYMGV